MSSGNSHVAFIYMVQKKIEVINIEYFIDGCTVQCKNYKNFAKLCHHQKDFRQVIVNNRVMAEVGQCKR